MYKNVRSFPPENICPAWGNFFIQSFSIQCQISIKNLIVNFRPDEGLDPLLFRAREHQRVLSPIVELLSHGGTITAIGCSDTRSRHHTFALTAYDRVIIRAPRARCPANCDANDGEGVGRGGRGSVAARWICNIEQKRWIYWTLVYKMFCSLLLRFRIRRKATSVVKCWWTIN